MYSYNPDSAPALPAYAELHCLSNFSFMCGASHPEELVARAAELGYAALAITDECSFAGVVRAYQAVRSQGLALRLIIGTEIGLADGPRIVLLARDREGYAQLSRLITQGRRSAAKGSYCLTRQDLGAGIPRCIAILIPSFTPLPDAAELLVDACWLRGLFGDRAALAISLARGPDDGMRLQTLLAVAEQAGVTAIASSAVLMHDRSRRRLADVLAATRLCTTVAEAGMALAPNAERRLHPRQVLARRYPARLLEATLRVAAQCTFDLGELRYEYPAEITPEGQSPRTWLRHLVEQGLRWRYRQVASGPADGAAAPAKPAPSIDPAPPKVRAQIEHELGLIADLNYEAYFLTVHDIVRFARSRDILCQGRGSAANSVVCWALGITEVDPQLGIMLVERFISRERNEPPDIDVDFEHSRREEVIQYLYAKYGRERAALTAVVTCYRPRSALRDVGRALGFPLEQIERLTRDHFWFDGRRILPERLAEAGLDPTSPTVMRLVELATELMGFPRHLSQHVGGFVIARGRLDELVPIENAAMADRTVIQWDKDDLDTLGLLKIDVLALGMLSALRRSLALVSVWRACPLTLADIPREVPEVYAMLSRADSVGVFQVESRAQMTMLPRLQPRRFYDLVVEVAIVRPGPIQGGMVHPYLEARARAARNEVIDYPRPEPGNAKGAGDGVQSVLERTLGVPIFQEQVMQLAVVAAGFTPGEADQLRRAMGAWRRKGELERYREKLLAGLAEHGYSPVFAERLCSQIEGFGSYGFPESHAASFALLVYFSAWLKCFEPAAFLCGLLNSQPMGFYSPSQLIQDARRHGVVVRSPDVTVSLTESCLEPVAPGEQTEAVEAGEPNKTANAGAHTKATEPGTSGEPAVRLGLGMVKGLGQELAAQIVAARAGRPFASVDDLAQRARLDPATVSLLASAGALNALAGNRHEALWQAAGSRPADGVLSGAPMRETALALAAPTATEDMFADYARLGFTLGRHPLAFLRESLAGMRFIPACDIQQCADRQLARAAGLVTCRQRPATAKGTLFITLEDETGLINIIVRPELVERQRRILLGARLLGVYGQISRHGEVVHLQAGRVVDHSSLLGELASRSRDFH